MHILSNKKGQCIHYTISICASCRLNTLLRLTCTLHNLTSSRDTSSLEQIFKVRPVQSFIKATKDTLFNHSSFWVMVWFTNTLTMHKKGVMFKESLTLTCLHTVTESTLNERSKIFKFLLLLTILPYQNVHFHLPSIFPKYMAQNTYYH